MAFFHKEEEKKEEYVIAKKRIIMEQLEDNDQRAATLIDKEKDGSPLVLNFGKLDLMACNKLLAFFTGATYAINGKSIKINETTYLFARSIDFEDGSLNDFLNKV